MAGRILVLDDEENYAEMLQDLLREHDYCVDMATRPERAMDQLEDIPYDLVISDYKMPVMDGADFLSKARQLYPNLPFILVSGLMNTPELVKVANMGVTLVMEKPLDTEAFLDHVARFSSPMTPEEKQAMEQAEAQSSGSNEVELSTYPEEPRFFSATSDASKRFLHEFWQAARASAFAVIQEPEGGDAELAVKDLSVWLGNHDLPVKQFQLSELQTLGIGRIESGLSQHEVSNVAFVRVPTAEELSAVSDFCQRADWKAADALRLIFVVEGALSLTELKGQAGEHAVSLPPLCQRPSDLAGYARRFARLACDRTGKTGCADFSNEAALAILTYPWPGNYKEVQETLTNAVGANEAEPLSFDALYEALKFNPESVVLPKRRMSKLMQLGQATRLRQELENQYSGDFAKLAKDLELEDTPPTMVELAEHVLLDPKLGEI